MSNEQCACPGRFRLLIAHCSLCISAQESAPGGSRSQCAVNEPWRLPRYPQNLPLVTGNLSLAIWPTGTSSSNPQSPMTSDQVRDKRMRADFDIAVIGSGFGGSLLAMIARRLGRSVALLERDRHPRFAIGESSTPLANLILEELARRYDLPQVAPLAKW